MIRAVLDTNSLASGFTTRGGISDLILQHWLLGTFELIVSEEIIEELIGVFGKPYFQARMPAEQAAANVRLLRTRATLLPVTFEVHGVATHPEDDVILALAVSAQTDYLVTGDRRFRGAVPDYQGVRLVSPREFLDLLERPTV
jgi:putative PIN family toxin of toxin-antitoxin system